MAIGTVEKFVKKSSANFASEISVFSICSKLGERGFTKNLPNFGPSVTVTAQSGADYSFYRRLFNTGVDEEKDEISVLDWNTANEQQETVAHWNAFMTHKDLNFFIEAPSMLTPPSKESLVTLLELAEDLGCRNAFICVEKSNPKLSELLRVFMYLGFHLCDPSVMQKVVKKEVKDYILLGYDLE